MIDLPSAVIGSLCTAIGGIAVTIITALFNERSKRNEREWNDKQKQTDRDIAERYKQLDRELAERTRQLDLYKVVYPEKVKAATNLMGRAGTLFMDVRAYYLGAQDKEQAAKLGSEVDDLLWLAKSYEFLLGSEVIMMVSEFRLICIMAFLRQRERGRDKEDLYPAILDGDVWAHEASYKQLSEALRAIVHLDTLGALLVPTQKGEPKVLPKPSAELVVAGDAPQVAVVQSISQ
jgi:hypothetical protein